MFTWITIYTFIKFWLPIVTAIGIVGKLFLMIRKSLQNAKNDVSAWASTLLDNHMAHIQAAAERASESLTEMVETNKTVAVAMSGMRQDFQASQTSQLAVQHEILTGLEVIKAKLD